MPPVTVVILNWNGKHWLEQFLPSVMASTYSAMQVMVVDNASTDDSVFFVQEHYPQIELVVLDENYGFAEGNNQALPHIKTPYFVLLNSDVEVEPDWLEPLVVRMETDPQIASIQPRVRSWHQKDSFEYAGAAGGLLDRFCYPFCRGRLFDDLEIDRNQYTEAIDIFWATGACCLIRKSVVEEIGLFEPEYFAHMEEIDFCWRALNHGFRIICEPKSVVYHVGGGALAQGSPRKTYLNVRNSLATMLRNLPSAQIFPKILVRLSLDGVWGLRSILRWDWKTVGAILKAHFHFYGKLPYWLKTRREIYRDKKVIPRLPQNGYYPKSVVWAYFAKGQKKIVLQSKPLAVLNSGPKA